MSEHAELVAELSANEKLPTGERLKHAKKKRAQQLKRFVQYEKALEKESVKKARKTSSTAPVGAASKTSGKKSARIRFVSNVILLEAAARNDVDEGKIYLLVNLNFKIS